MNCPDRALVCESRPSPAEQRIRPGQVLGLQKELAEGGVGQVGTVVIEDWFHVACQLQLTRLAAVVGQGDPADLGELLWRHGDLEQGLDVRVAPAQ